MLDLYRLKKAKKELQLTKKLLVEVTDDHISAIQNSIDDVCQLLINFKKHNYSKHNGFLNLCIFSDIVSVDLTILLEKIRLANRVQERRLYARVIAMTIVDYLDNISVLIGRDCLSELKNNNMNEFIEEFKSIHKNFSDFKKSNDRLLRDIRNNTIAHKSKDALKLNENINKINVEEIYDFGIKLKVFSKDFIDLSTKILYYIAGYMKEGKRI